MRVNIGTRLAGGFVVGTAITILVGLIALYALGKTNDSANRLLNIEVSEMALSNQLIVDLAAARRLEKEFFLFSETGDATKQSEYGGKLADSWATISRDADKFYNLPEQSIAREGAAELNRLVEQSQQSLSTVNRQILAGKRYQAVETEYREFETSVNQLEEMVVLIAGNTREEIEARQQNLLRTQSTLRNLVIATVAASVVLALTLGSLLTRSITQPVRRLSESLRKVAAGDFSHKATFSYLDEIGELSLSFNQMTDNLQVSKNTITRKNGELESLNSELNAANRELTAANQKLKDTQEKLVRSEKLAAIGQLAGGVGHELRNPLGSIKNATYYIKGKLRNRPFDQSEGRVIEFLNIIEDEINTANKIISDLLDFARTGKPTVSPARVETAIEDALSHLEIPANIRLVRELADGAAEINVDSDQIRQVLFNLMLNAVEAMPDGGELKITTGRKGESLEIKVIDTGQGIPEDIKAKIFDPLFTTKAKGTGLGLALCRSIIERHDGHIEVESPAGKGATFTVTLPLAEGDDGES